MSHSRLPFGLAGINPGVKAGGYGLAEDTIKSFPLESYRKGYLLTFFGAPARTVHHPQKVGFNPAHPVKAKLTAEITLPGCKMARSRAIRLIYHYGLLVELGQKVTASLRPALSLESV